MTSSHHRIARYRRGRLALGIAGAYALLVLGTAGFVLVASTLTSGSLAGVWLIVLTLPVSVPLSLVPLQGLPHAVLLALGGVGQAAVLWLLLRGSRVE